MIGILLQQVAKVPEKPCECPAFINFLFKENLDITLLMMVISGIFFAWLFRRLFYFTERRDPENSEASFRVALVVFFILGSLIPVSFIILLVTIAKRWYQGRDIFEPSNDFTRLKRHFDGKRYQYKQRRDEKKKKRTPSKTSFSRIQKFVARKIYN